MRFVSLLLLLPVAALAQQPASGPQMDPQQFFEQTKKMMLPMFEETLPVMRKARDCMQAAESPAEMEACGEIMADLRNKMLARMGPPPGMPADREPPPMKDPQDVEWNAERKKNMLLFLDRSILAGSAMQECLNQSSGMEQMQQCMQAKKPKP